LIAALTFPEDPHTFWTSKSLISTPAWKSARTTNFYFHRKIKRVAKAQPVALTTVAAPPTLCPVLRAPCLYLPPHSPPPPAPSALSAAAPEFFTGPHPTACAAQDPPVVHGLDDINAALSSHRATIHRRVTVATPRPLYDRLEDDADTGITIRRRVIVATPRPPL
jgi:hypothetical protein